MFDASFFQPSTAAGAEAVNKDDAALVVLFTLEPVRNDAKTEKAGRPIFDPIEMVRIFTPGSRDEVHKPVTDVERQRFSDRYARFKAAAQATATDGTALEEWPALAKTQLYELKAVGIHTVDQLAALGRPSASGLPLTHRLGPNGDELIARGQAFLDLARDSATAERLAAENVRLRADVQDLRAENARLAALVATLKDAATAAQE